MPHFQLDPVETRILGCMLEKERLTPENYPISMNSLTAACNQTTNRDPIMGLDESTVNAGMTALREKRLATMIHAAGARVPKYRHNFPDHYDLNPREISLLCVLMLRGPQTPGELRARTERMGAFPSLEELESTLNNLCKGDDPLVRILPARLGQKERRYVQLLSGEPVEPEQPVFAPTDYTAAPIGPSMQSRMETLETESAALRAELSTVKGELSELRNAFEQFKAQFGA